MSSFALASVRAVVAIVVLCAALAAPIARAAAAEPKATPAVETRKSPSCGGLPRGSRAYKDCLAAQSRRDPVPAPATAKPTSSR